MNDNIEGIPYSEAEFDKDGKLIKEPSVPDGTTDLIVASHGWNNDREGAEALYSKLFENFAAVTADDPAIKARKIAIVGIIWPSKKFTDFISRPPAAKSAGGAASAGGIEDKAASEAAMHEAIDRAALLFDDPGDAARIAALHDLIGKLEDNQEGQEEFVETLRALLEPEGAKTEEQSKNDGSAVFFRAPADVLFERASQPGIDTGEGSAPGGGIEAVEGSGPEGGVVVSSGSDSGAVEGAGKAAGIGSFFSSVGAAVTRLLNLTSYYEMKKRAGTVGKQGVAPLIDKLAENVQRIHLVGHSFGGRVMAAAASNSTNSKIGSVSLLQAAFSHNGFSQRRSGFFRNLVKNKRVNGPILVTHTKNDRAVGAAYPLASHISRDSAAGFGDADDEFGGIGSNGAQNMEEGEIAAQVTELQDTGQPYSWEPGKFHNLESSKFIVDPQGGDAHGFVYVPQVAWAISRAIVSSA